ncbi:predicted protein [Naegleria gruberi]|uniref:Predicted protein n=1 Tax=Naegleria gruberi TaxID=5762 RepID=D2V2G3_NAEGR|nr:uncharacterized protein NAEGRDRAFT_62991 [Naegleria gruberi]EFC49054.1 predicted protein [Naegleria gruberi]|eukprot:XP_002681798.1 predicted protein [Naegleria gruberi strain NEG-M]
MSKVENQSSNSASSRSLSSSSDNRKTDNYNSSYRNDRGSSSRRYSPNRRSDSRYDRNDSRRDNNYGGSRERRLYDDNRDNRDSRDSRDDRDNYKSERREYNDRRINSSNDNKKDMNETLKRKLEERQTEQKRQKKSPEDEDYLDLGDDKKEEKQQADGVYSLEDVAKEIWTDEKDFILKPTSVDQLIEINKIHILRREERENKFKEFERKKKEKKEKKNKKEKKEKSKKKDKSSSKQDDEIAGPKLLSDLMNDQSTKYEVPLLPGEGAAIAEFIQQNKRIPRRGEVGLTSDQITNYEDLGYVMSGSRHARMNAIRIMKENEVYMQEEKKRLDLLQKQERSQRENKIISQFRDIAKKEQ